MFHLAKRELTLTHRWTLLGWAWPLTRQLAQLAVLVFVFSSVLDLGIEDFPVFVFSGLVAWSWFSSGLGKATSCLIAQRHLLFQARFPAVVLPIVAVAVPFVDVLMALPILVVMAITSSGLHASMTLLPAVVVVQLVLMAGLAWITSAVSVYVRDVPQVVLVGLTLLFYLTPVFYDASRVPEEYRWILQLNPMTTLLDLYRALLLGHPFPAVAHVVAVTALSVGVALLGYTLFKRLQPGFVDEL